MFQEETAQLMIKHDHERFSEESTWRSGPAASHTHATMRYRYGDRLRFLGSGAVWVSPLRRLPPKPLLE